MRSKLGQIRVKIQLSRVNCQAHFKSRSGHRGQGQLVAAVRPALRTIEGRQRRGWTSKQVRYNVTGYNVTLLYIVTESVFCEGGIRVGEGWVIIRPVRLPYQQPVQDNPTT